MAKRNWSNDFISDIYRVDWFRMLVNFKKAGKNTSEVSRMLGLSPQTVHRWNYTSVPKEAYGMRFIELYQREFGTPLPLKEQRFEA